MLCMTKALQQNTLCNTVFCACIDNLVLCSLHSLWRFTDTENAVDRFHNVSCKWLWHRFSLTDTDNAVDSLHNVQKSTDKKHQNDN